MAAGTGAGPPTAAAAAAGRRAVAAAAAAAARALGGTPAGRREAGAQRGVGAELEEAGAAEEGREGGHAAGHDARVHLDDVELVHARVPQVVRAGDAHAQEHEADDTGHRGTGGSFQLRRILQGGPDFACSPSGVVIMLT